MHVRLLLPSANIRKVVSCLPLRACKTLLEYSLIYICIGGFTKLSKSRISETSLGTVNINLPSSVII